MTVSSFAEIDDHLRERRCACGGRYDVLGERSCTRADRRLRMVRAECGICEREAELYFDVTELFH